MKKIVLFLMLIIFMIMFLKADIYVKRVKETAPYEIMGKKRSQGVEIEEVWLGKDRFTSITKEMTIIMNFSSGKLYFAVNKIKTFFEIPLDLTREKLRQMLPQKIADIILSIEIRSVKTSVDRKIRKIGNWNCFKTELEMDFVIPALNIMPKFKLITWLSNDVPFDYKKYKKGMSDFFENFFSRLIKIDKETEKNFDRLEHVQGFEVGADAEINLFGSKIKSNMRMIDFKECKAPAGIYYPPKGFKKKSLYNAFGIKK